MKSSTQIGVWGISEAGKTTYMVALITEIMRRNTKDSEKFEWHTPLETESFKEFFSTDCRSFQQEGVLPRPTDTGRPREVNIIITHPDEGSFNIRLMDVAGELVLRDEDTDGYFAALRQSQGILLFFKSTMSQAEIRKTRQGIRILADELRKAPNSKEIRLALCVTQVDQDKAWNNFQIVANPCKFLRKKILGEIRYVELTSLCPIFDCFSVSSVGRYRNKQNLNEDGKIANRQKWTPHNILMPFFWLVDHINK